MPLPYPASPTRPSASPRRHTRMPSLQRSTQLHFQPQMGMSSDIPLHNQDQQFTNARPESGSNNQNPMTLDVPAAHHYAARLFPTSAKRKRYSFDDVTFKLDKVRGNRSRQARINIVPPDDNSPEANNFTSFRPVSDWHKHIDGSFATLPFDLQSSLSAALTTRSVSAHKASDRIIRDLSTNTIPQATKSSSFDLISAISSSIDILALVGTYLRPRDVLHLYSISRAFHATLDTHMRSSVLRWAHHSCPLASEIFPYQFYAGATVADPMCRPRDPAYHDIFARLSAKSSLPDTLLSSHGGGGGSSERETRQVPSLRWLQMVHARSTRTRDIVASLARRGHRLPPGSDGTLLKLWLVADLPTNADRCAVVRSTAYFTRSDLYRAAVFLVKLLMRTNDPLYGPDHGVLVELVLGQRGGLTPLWRLLRGKEGFATTLKEVTAAKMRYDVRPTVEELKRGLPVLGVPVAEMGRGHLEGWGQGKEHLLRLDELIVRECARRGIEMEECVESMVVYGHVDIAKGVDLVPSLEELYMSDEEMPQELSTEEDGRKRGLVYGGGGNVPFNEGEWNPKLVKKARWDTLSNEVKKAIEEDDRDEILRSLRWEEDSRALSVEGSEGGEETDDERHANDVKGKGKLGVPMEKHQEPDVLDSDSVLGGEDEGDDGDISDEEDGLDGFYERRVCSSTMPELSSRVCSSATSVPVMTPPPEGSPDLVGIHYDQDMDEMDIDDDNIDTTLMPSSATVTPLKFAPSQAEGGGSELETSSDEEDSENQVNDEERQRLAAERDEELLAQADQYYSEDELEYDWDAWKEQADVVIGARDGVGSDEDEGEEEDSKGYHRLY